MSLRLRGGAKSNHQRGCKSALALRPELRRWLSPECVRVRDASTQLKQVGVTDGPSFYGANAKNFLADVTYLRKTRASAW